jgi:hypothetical protein
LLFPLIEKLLLHSREETLAVKISSFTTRRRGARSPTPTAPPDDGDNNNNMPVGSSSFESLKREAVHTVRQLEDKVSKYQQVSESMIV